MVKKGIKFDELKNSSNFILFIIAAINFGMSLTTFIILVVYMFIFFPAILFLHWFAFLAMMLSYGSKMFIRKNLGSYIEFSKLNKMKTFRKLRNNVIAYIILLIIIIYLATNLTSSMVYGYYYYYSSSTMMYVYLYYFFAFIATFFPIPIRRNMKLLFSEEAIEEKAIERFSISQPTTNEEIMLEQIVSDLSKYEEINLNDYAAKFSVSVNELTNIVDNAINAGKIQEFKIKRKGDILINKTLKEMNERIEQIAERFINNP
ncbi:MAG: PCI domain-containing protein [Promethearchaeia archaeon]